MIWNSADTICSLDTFLGHQQTFCISLQDIHHQIKPEEVELVRRDYMANEGWETFLSYEDTRQVIWSFFPFFLLLVPILMSTQSHILQNFPASTVVFFFFTCKERYRTVFKSVPLCRVLLRKTNQDYSCTLLIKLSCSTRVLWLSYSGFKCSQNKGNANYA